MILQTGQRTDIPAFYGEWLCNRVREGFVLVRNPYNPSAVTRIRIDPEVVDLMVFCTKNPGPVLARLDALEAFRQYWFVTITPYGKDIEENVPAWTEVTESFRALSRRVGARRMAWRYDPVLIHGPYTRAFHLERFSAMAAALEGYTHTCVISFVDLYGKTVKNFPGLDPVSLEDRLYLGERMAEIARERGMVLRPCGEGELLKRFGADCGGCSTLQVYEEAIGERLSVSPADLRRGRTRSECACCLTSDIGQYNTCPHLCRYCYANADREAVLQNFRSHDPASPFLIGHGLPGDVIREAKQESWIDRQLRFDFV